MGIEMLIRKSILKLFTRTIYVNYMPQLISAYRKHVTLHTTETKAALSNNPCSFYESYE